MLQIMEAFLSRFKSITSAGESSKHVCHSEIKEYFIVLHQRNPTLSMGDVDTYIYIYWPAHINEQEIIITSLKQCQKYYKINVRH
jgi:hypothetical protein